MAESTVTLTTAGPDGKPITVTVPADEADKYTHGGWSVAEKPSK